MYTMIVLYSDLTSKTFEYVDDTMLNRFKARKDVLQVLTTPQETLPNVPDSTPKHVIGDNPYNGS